jgi:hypothetical protein
MPLYPDQPALGTQTIYTPLAADATTTLTTFSTLLSQSIVIQEDSYLLIRASMGTSDSISTAGQNYFRVTVDGVAYGTAGAEIFTCIQSSAICVKVGPLAGGNHDVALEWQTAAGNTLRCRPLTQAEQASLITTEVTDREID